MAKRGSSLSVVFLTIAVAGCGGGANPQPETPNPEVGTIETTTTPEAQAGALEPAPAGDIEQSPIAPDDAEASGRSEPTRADTTETTAAPPIPSTPKRTPKQMLTEPGVGFVIDHASSTMAEANEAACAKKVGDDKQAEVECLRAARDAFKPDVMAFKREGPNVYRWVVYNRKGQELNEIYSVPIIIEEDSDTITIKPKGAGKGTRPILAGQETISVTVPNDYSIELTDPKLGKLVYDAKYNLSTE